MQDNRVERYWSERAAKAHDDVLARVPKDRPEREAYLWTCVNMALEARDPQSLCGVFRVCDLCDAGTDMRFATAIRAMSARAYDCAYAAWDDAGQCWSQESETPNVPSSRAAAEAIKSACEPLIENCRLSDEAESSLCAGIREKLS
nr:hypothetical protein TetV2_00411 [Oceanusvirus sp.]